MGRALDQESQDLEFRSSKWANHRCSLGLRCLMSEIKGLENDV